MALPAAMVYLRPKLEKESTRQELREIEARFSKGSKQGTQNGKEGDKGQ